MQSIVYTNLVQASLEQSIARMKPASVFIITDVNVDPLTPDILPSARRIVIPAGDSAKTLSTAESVWSALAREGATRSSLAVNLGGGMVTDLGGFCAATFKRGMSFINVPTTLLGAVDAAVGGKTGINFMGLKNEIGVFRPADEVIVSTRFFSTLPQSELMSGYAEMIKHALLHSPELLAQTLDHDPADTEALLPLLEKSIGIKRDIVDADPTEQGMRRALNLGHTAGHAFEALAMSQGQPVPHGYAVARGLVVELALSRMLSGLPTTILENVARFVREHYSNPAITCDDYPALLSLMSHDKKNHTPDRINFTLLEAPGKAIIDNEVAADDITTALDIFRDLCE